MLRVILNMQSDFDDVESNLCIQLCEYVVTVNGTKVNNETYYYVQGKLVASNKDSVLKYFFTDHLGSTRFVANSTGYIEDRYEYMPFGATVQDSSRYMYTGRELDDTGLEYYGARYYDPQLSRWIYCTYCNKKVKK